MGWSQGLAYFVGLPFWGAAFSRVAVASGERRVDLSILVRKVTQYKGCLQDAGKDDSRSFEIREETIPREIVWLKYMNVRGKDQGFGD